MAFAEWIDDGGDVLLDQENGPAPGLWRYSLGGGLATGVFGANAPYPSWAPRDVAGPESDFPPVTSGTASVGETLEASVGTWSPAQGATFSFSWSRCTNNNTSCVPISGAEDSVYQASSADVGFSLMATVTATYEGVSRQASSELFGPVEVASPYATALPTVAGTSTLTLASPGSWTGSPTFAEQWLRCDVNGANCAPIAGQTGTAYAPGTADQGSTIRVAVTGTNPGGASVATSEAVAVGAGLPGAPTNASAVAGNGQVTVSFTAPSANGGSPISSYTVSSSPGGVQATGVGESDYGLRADKRDQLHVHGHRNERRWYRRGVGGDRRGDTHRYRWRRWGRQQPRRWRRWRLGLDLGRHRAGGAVGHERSDGVMDGHGHQHGR